MWSFCQSVPGWFEAVQPGLMRTAQHIGKNAELGG